MAMGQEKAKESHRLQFRFWLDVTKQGEYELAETIENLKEKRGFAKAIRDGLRLFSDLKAGRWEVLRELFPWVVDAIYDAAQADILAKTPPATKQDDAPMPDAIQAQLDRLERLLLQQGAMPVEKQLPSKTPILLPVLDEPTIEIQTAKSDEKPAYNFMISNAKSGLIPLENLPREVIEYGVQKGRLPATLHQKQPSAKKNKGKKSGLPEPPVAPDDTHLVTVTALQASTTIKKMAIPDIAAPRFDELDDDIDLFS